MKIKILLITFFLLFLLSFVSKIIFPSDILNYFPSFTEGEWQATHNSLLADPVLQFEPWRHFAKENILRGVVPLWNPLNGGGSPFLANPQVAILSPFTIAYYLLPISVSLNFLTISKLVLFFIFSYVYLRKLKVSKLPAVLGSLVVSTSGFFITWILWPHTNVYVFLPLLLYLIEKYKFESRLSLWFPLVYVFSILGGHPETLFHISVLIVIYAIYRLGFTKKLVFFSSYILLSILISSALLLPFLEYLFQSYALQKRTTEALEFYLPTLSIFSNFVPFLLGAPHTAFYKSFSSYTNFQETIGGYAGLIGLIFGFRYYKPRDKDIKVFWAAVSIISIFIAYNIFPFNLLKQIPFLEISADHRVIAFLNFSLGILMALSIDDLLRKRKDNFLRAFGIIGIAFFLPLFLLLFFVINKFVQLQFLEFGNYLLVHICLIALSLFLFMFFLSMYIRRKSIMMGAVLVILLFSQTGLLFITYNTLSSVNSYYPRTSLINSILKQEKGRVLEVGNHNLPPNSNLIYGIEQAENDDAIELREYREFFDSQLPIKNHLKNVDQVEISPLRELGIKYVVADYDLNTSVINLQKNIKDRVHLYEKAIDVSFHPETPDLAGIRLITINFNRLNSCKLSIEVREKSTDKLVGNTTVSCYEVSDNGFYYVPLQSYLDISKDYVIRFSPIDFSNSNSIGLLGESGRPYIDILYKNAKGFKELWSENSLYLFQVPDVNIISGFDNYKIINETSTNLTVEYINEEKSEVVIKRNNYNGWNVKIDGKKIKTKQGPFFAFHVPVGKHLIELNYKPTVLYLGAAMSFLGLILYSFLVARHNRDKLIKLFRSMLIKKIDSYSSLKYLTISLTVAVIVTLTIIWVIPLRLKPVFSTAINWYTANQYPRYQDYIYTIGGIFLILAIAIVVFYILVVLNRKK